MILIGLCSAEVYSRGARIGGLAKAFADISEALVKQNHEVMIVADEYSSHWIESITSAAIAKVPHKVSLFWNTQRFLLNTSAVVLLESIA